MHKHSSFITLTYDEKNWEMSLKYSDFQKFLYKLRTANSHKDDYDNRWHLPIRYFACGEYGDLNNRPHFHAILFGKDFPRDYPVKTDVWGSKELDKLWGNGHAGHGEVTMQSAAYVAGYTLKKRTGKHAETHYERIDPFTGEIQQVEPEMGRMSLKPGIGYTWFQKYWKEIYKARDGVVTKGGITYSPPRYYDKLIEQIDENMIEDKKWERYLKGEKYRNESTPERLKTQEIVLKAKIKQKQRQL